MRFLLLFSVFVIATCGLVYELISAALASYLLGDSITQFSLIIGVYLFSMGIGSYLSRFVKDNLLGLFVHVEFLIGAIGGSSAAILFLLFEKVASFHILLYTFVVIIGTLVGFEIPCLMRLLKSHFDFKDLVSRVFTYDYVGALVGSVLFPLVLVPHLGLVRSSFMFGIFNVLVALFTLHFFRYENPWVKIQRVFGSVVLVGLAMGFCYSDKILSLAEATTYVDPVIYSKNSPYQRIVLTKSKSDIKLFLNGNLQFSSKDEYRYHEALVHVGMQGLTAPKKVLVLGGGDGLAVREVLKYPTVDSILLVDLDPAVTQLFKARKDLRSLNANSLLSPKVTIINEDAFQWLQKTRERFDFVVVDFPDPSNYSVGKLFTTTFYKSLYSVVSEAGAIVVQSTSPYFAPKSFWCVENTVKSVGFRTLPYHAYVPSFGEWGFVLASKRPFTLPRELRQDLKLVSEETVEGMLRFPSDMKKVETEINRLNSQILVRYFEEEWSQYAH